MGHLGNINQQIKSRALSHFDEKTKFETDSAEPFRDELISTIDRCYKEVYEKAQEVIYRKSNSLCHNLHSSTFYFSQSTLILPQITPKEFESEVMNPLEGFFKKAQTRIGKIFCVVGEFIINKTVSAVGEFFKEQLSGYIESLFEED